jgi:hypothetical protein
VGDRLSATLNSDVFPEARLQAGTKLYFDWPLTKNSKKYWIHVVGIDSNGVEIEITSEKIK